jgi:hypothetical protein
MATLAPSNGESKIAYNDKVKLTAPEGGVLKSIKVRVTVEPKDAGLLIYGHGDAQTMIPVQVGGGTTVLDLPFFQPEILVKHLLGLTSYRIEILGWRDARRAPF